MTGGWLDRGGLGPSWLTRDGLLVEATDPVDDVTRLDCTGDVELRPGAVNAHTHLYSALAPQVAGIRRFGAASLDLAWVAAGRFDGFWESALSPWDTAAGCLLVREAGGFVSDWRGVSQPVCDVQVLAANDVLHSKLHKSLVGGLKA